MRVGFVLQDGSREASGLDTYVWNLWDALRSIEGEHELVPVTLPARIARRAYLRLMWEQLYLPLWAWRQKLGVLHVPAGTAPVLSRTPSVLTLHDLGDDPSPRYHTPAGPRMYFGRVVPWSARFAAGLITDSEAIRREAITRLGVPRDRVRVARLAAPPWCVRASEAAVARVRAQYSLRDPYYLQVGAGMPRKNLRGALAAFAKLLERAPGLPVRFVATGRTETAELDPEVADLARRGVVRFLGHVPCDDLAALYTGALAVVVPSFYEGFGLPLVEAFACGTPGIASRVASLPEVGGDAALYVDPADPESIAGAMEQYATSPELRRRMSLRANERNDEFSWQRTARETLEVYRQVVAARSSRKRSRAVHSETPSVRERLGPKVLFVRLDSLGDVVLTTPCLDALIQTYPDVRIDVVVQPSAAPLLKDDPRVSRVFTLAPPWRGRPWPAGVIDAARMLRALRRERYAYVVTFRRDLDDALFARLCGGRQTLGFRAKRTRSLLTASVPFDDGQHTLENHLQLMTLLGCESIDRLPTIACTSGDPQRIDRLLAADGCAQPIAIAPFGSSTAKCLPTSFGSALVNAVADAAATPIVLLGDASHRPRAIALRTRVDPQVIDLVGCTSLPELRDVLRECRLLVTVDSGPMHIAAALGVPVVALFGAEDPVLWAPRGPGQQRILQGRNQRGRAALDTIPIERIVEAVRDLMTSPTSQRNATPSPVGVTS